MSHLPYEEQLALERFSRWLIEGTSPFYISDKTVDLMYSLTEYIKGPDWSFFEAAKKVQVFIDNAVREAEEDSALEARINSGRNY